MNFLNEKAPIPFIFYSISLSYWTESPVKKGYRVQGFTSEDNLSFSANKNSAIFNQPQPALWLVDGWELREVSWEIYDMEGLE